MATTALPSLENLAAKEAESDKTTAYPQASPVPPGVSTIFANSATTLTATAGGGTLPATPAGFIEVAIGGLLRKVPFYDA